MKQFFKRLFCKHDYEFYMQMLIDAGMRKLVLHKCTKCGKFKVYIV